MESIVQPNVCVLHIIREVKVCQGCIQEEYSRYEFRAQNQWTKEALLEEGILDRWGTCIPHGKHFLQRAVVRHVDDHPKCYNYVIKALEEMHFEFIEKC